MVTLAEYKVQVDERKANDAYLNGEQKALKALHADYTELADLYSEVVSHPGMLERGFHLFHLIVLVQEMLDYVILTRRLLAIGRLETELGIKP